MVAHATPSQTPRQQDLLSAFLHSDRDLFEVADDQGIPLQELLDFLDSEAVQDTLRRMLAALELRSTFRAAAASPAAIEKLHTLLDLAQNPAELRRTASTLLRARAPTRHRQRAEPEPTQHAAPPPHEHDSKPAATAPPPPPVNSPPPQVPTFQPLALPDIPLDLGAACLPLRRSVAPSLSPSSSLASLAGNTTPRSLPSKIPKRRAG